MGSRLAVDVCRIGKSPSIYVISPDRTLLGSCRAAQRAFRERKQTQLADLQARLHSYEQGEIERNIALQNVAKKMKDENEELRKENRILREKITRLEQGHSQFLDKDGKRSYDDASTSSLSLLPDNSATKRARMDIDAQETPPPSAPHLPSQSSLVSSVPTGSAPEGHESLSQHPVFHPPPPIHNTFPFTTTDATTSSMEEDIVERFGCILCSPDEPCVCRQATVEQTASGLFDPLSLQSENLDQRQITSPKKSVQHVIASTNSTNSPPAFQAPVPIRRRAGTSRANVFPVTPIATTSSSLVPKCSGDPDNCVACTNDNFGKAFCQAISHTLSLSLPCVDCPKNANQPGDILLGGCCGNISECGSCGIAPIISSPTPSRGPETMPTDDAWRQLKSHPNVAFADLTLLAEVVARRSKCTGSRLVVSPALESAIPDDDALPSHHEPIPAEKGSSVLLMDAQEDFRQQRQRESPPQLVPQHVLIECGRRKMREVNADGVREALRLLDQKLVHRR